MRIVERDKPQPETVIPATAKWDDLIAPVDYVTWESSIRDWQTQPLLPPSQSAPAYKGKTFSVFLPVEIDGKQKNYLFTFQIADVVI
jgi:hypothetical protein